MNNNSIPQATNFTYGRYLFYWAGQMISLLGSTVVAFTLTWWITISFGKENSAIYLSLSMFLTFFPIILFAPIAGVIIDRAKNKKIIIVVSDFLQTLFTFILILYFLFDAVTIGILLMISFLRGCGQAFHQPAVGAVVPLLIPRERLLRQNGFTFLVNSVIGIIGPTIGAFLLSRWEIEYILWVDFFTFVLALIPLIFIPIPKIIKPRSKSVKKKGFFRDFSEGLKTMRNIKGFSALIFLGMILNFLIAPISVLRPHYVKWTHLGTEYDLAFVSICSGSAILIGSLITIVKKQWKRKKLIYFGGLSLIFIGFIVIALAPVGNFLFIGIGYAISFWAVPILVPVISTIIQTKVPFDKMGRINSINMGLSSFMTPLGYILAGPLEVLIGARLLFYGCSIFGILSIILSYTFSDTSIFADDKTNDYNWGKTVFETENSKVQIESGIENDERNISL